MYQLSDSAQRVFAALENPKYHWRTLTGIAAETGIDAGEIAKVLYSPALADQIIRATVPTRDGQPLFTTRRHYYRNQSFLNRLFTALSDRVAG
jgi:hypothetical protein